MPGAYRYSATFDRTYEEDPPPPAVDERSRSRNGQSPARRSLSANGIHHRSASTDSLDSICGSSGSSTSHSRQVSIDNVECIPTRVVKKASAKPAHNPLQFVKVSSCPLSRKAEQLAKKKPEHKEKVKDEEEEWQSNLDNWKSRRRKQSEGALLRLEEIRRIELEEQQRQQEQKKTKTKTFSEMMEERAQRPKQYNLRISGRRASESVLNLGYDFENGRFEKQDSNDNSSCDRDSSDSTLCDSAAEEITDTERQALPKKDLSESVKESKVSGLSHRRHSTGGNNQIIYNRIEKSLSGIDESELENELAKEKLLSSGGYTNTDSGLDSLSSSHKTGDIADSASDFSQDSGSSLDSDFHHTTGSLTTGVELLEEFSSRVQSFSENVMPNYEQKGGNGLELFLRIWLKQGSENKDFGFTLKERNDQNIPIVDSVIPGGVGDQAGLRKNDQILAINAECTQDIKHDALCFVVQQASYTGHLDLVIWRAFNNTGNAQENSSEETTKPVSSEDVQQKRLSETVEKQNSLVSNRKSSFEGEPKQKGVIQRTNKDIKPATDFKEKVSSFERRSSAEESFTLVSKPNSSKSRPPVPAKPPHLQSNGDLDTTSLNSKSKDNNSLEEEIVNTVNTNEEEVNNTNVTTVPTVSKCKTDSDHTSSKLVRTVSECDSKNVIQDAQHSAKDTSKPFNLNSELSANQITRSNSDRNTNEVPVQNYENEERYQPQRLINLHPICSESGLNIIYDSHPEQTMQEANTTKLNPPLPETEMKSKPKLISQECIDQTDAKKVDSKKSRSESAMVKSSTMCDKSDSELKKGKHCNGKLKLKQQNQSQKDNAKQQDDLNTNIYDIPLNLTQDDILLAELDLSCRKTEPPKEKPPPPPPDESDVECSEKPPVIRANSTKEIKRELWKRRSDFLGIEFENGPIEVDESKLPCPLAIEDILKSERELEREKRQLLEQQTMLRLRRLAEEEEIARKEREIIENIEREERERQQQALEMEAALLKEKELKKQANELNNPVNRKEAEMNGAQQPKNRKKEKSFESQRSSLQQLNSVSRLKNELPLQEKERYIKRQQDADTVKTSNQQPVKNDNEIKQSNVNSEIQASSQNNSSAVKSDDKEINNSTSNKTPTKKMILRQERERMRREQEALQKQDNHAMHKHHQQVSQASKQCKPNGVHQDIVPNRIAHDQSSTAQMSSNPWDREDIIYASRHPEAAPTSAKSENDIEIENGNQELPIQSRPLSKHNLHSLGAAPKAKVLTNEQWIKPNEKVAKRRTETGTESGYNQYHWLVQEAEIRRINEQKERQYQHSAEHRPAALPPQPPTTLHPHNNNLKRNQYQAASKHPPTHCALPCGYPFGYDGPRRNSAPSKSNGHSVDNNCSPSKPPRSSSREQLLSVSGRKRCSHCGNELGRGAAMIIESLQLFYHIQCFCCCVCQAQLGNGSCGTDVRVRNNKLHCQHCYSNDEAGLKFSQV